MIAAPKYNHQDTCACVDMQLYTNTGFSTVASTSKDRMRGSTWLGVLLRSHLRLLCRRHGLAAIQPNSTELI